MTYYAVYTTSGYTVTFQYLNSNGSSTNSVQTVGLNSYPANPGTPSAVTVGGTTYTFYCWSTNSSNNPWYVYKNQAPVSPTSQKVTGNITYYALYTAKVSTDITLTAAPGKSVDFDIGKFQDAYRSKYSSGTIDYVEFVVPSSYSNFSGTIYDGSTELSRSDLNSSIYYYSGGSSGSRLKDLSFQADKKAKSGDSLTLSYTAYASKNSYVDGKLILKVSGTSASGDIEYEVAPGKTVDFNSRDFRDYLRDTYKGEYLDYVRFDSVSISGGTLYHNYGKSGETSYTGSKLSKEYFYEDPGKNQCGLDNLTFVASNSFKSDLTIGFTAYSYTNSSHNVKGEVVIVSTSKGASGDIEYEVAPGKTVDLKATDFRKFLRDEEDSSSVVDYVEFKRPSSTSIFNDGTLYYDRGGRSETALTRSNISGYKFYYSPGSKDYDLDDLTFEAKSSFKDEIELDFTVYGTGKNEYATGTLVIKSTSKTEKGDINYEVTPGKTVNLKATDFRTFLRDEEDSKAVVDYVVFRKPSSTSIFDDGTLYYDRSGKSEITLTRSNISSYKFHYSPGSKEYDLDDLTFEAKSSFRDSITLDFTVYGTDDEEADGTLVIYTNSSAAAGSNYVGSIRYNTVSGTNVQINANDIARFLNQSLPGYSLQYVTLTGVPSSGTLYYNYYNASKYGTASRMALNSSNCAGQNFYFAPGSTAQYALTELTYVPSSYNYCASIPFTAYAANSLSVAGTILISVSQRTLSEVYGVTPRNTAVNFPASSIYNAVQSATGSGLYSIQLLKLPPANAGTIYVGSGTNTRAATNVQYTYSSGTNSISQLRFVPGASFTGSVEIPYVALNSSGTALASGTFSLGVVNRVKSFTDVGSGSWCYKYVAELSDANVISGYSNGSFKPDSTVSYGAALKLIMLAAGYPEQAPTTKNVFSGYLAKARADGLVSRNNVNLSAPITRLQVAQLAAGALKLNTSNLSSVKPFTDTSDLYVQALNAAGIVEGYFNNGTSTFRPNNSLTRGQMSAIVWRMQNYRK
ncbi:MAG: S-layer homology domain-containing protein [Oscillibacter sp.]|nr:S-layer homology domain-containing protein [Oscillibacter sp.]